MKLFKSKKFLLIVFVISVVGLYLYSKKYNAPVTESTEPTTSPYLKLFEKKEPGDRVTEERNRLKSTLPITIKDFKTSVGITTVINIYSISDKPDAAIYLEIYGVDYGIQDTQKNPDAIAFKESFLRAKQELESRGFSIKELSLVYGTRKYIQDTAELWVKEFNLL